MTAPFHFADRLWQAVKTKRSPVMVGLDPRFEMLPGKLRSPNPCDCGCQADNYRKFCCEVIDVVADRVPIVKPQAAFFEQLGPAGMLALADVIDYAVSKDLLVVVDGKRNDIGATAEAYASAYLGHKPRSAWGADALTVSPYLGDDSLEPFIKTAQLHGAGIFVLVKTSNPGGKLWQDLITDNQPLYHRVAEHVERLAVQSLGHHHYGAAGAVVGATYSAQLTELRAAMPHAWLLVPGFGTQGGTARDCAAAFDSEGLGAVVNNSRGIIFAHSLPRYKDKFGESHWHDAVSAAVDDMLGELRAETPAGKL